MAHKLCPLLAYAHSMSLLSCLATIQPSAGGGEEILHTKSNDDSYMAINLFFYAIQLAGLSKYYYY